VRNQFAESLYEIATHDPRIVIVVSDISPAGSMERFRKEFPDRFIDVGVAEQAMIGVCAGLALRGFKPFAYTIATFSIYRPFEMVRVDLCYQNLPVTVVGMGAGIIYSTLGGTHHTQEDIAVMSALPNMSILAPCDPLEVDHAVRFSGKHQGPLYLRIGKAGEPKLTEKAADPFEFGKLRYLERGSDIAIISYGHSMELAARLVDQLKERGHSVSSICCHTLKPLDRAGLGEVLRRHRLVAVIEEHSEVGGLAAQTKQVAWDTQAKCTLKTFSLKDEFIHLYGSHSDLRRAHGLDQEKILVELIS